jgi:alanyl-tRNA synthetase
VRISSYEIIEKFLSFFVKNNHFKIENSSIIPKNDHTLLFINSGMAAIKSYFTGEEKPPRPELCNIQSCIRTIDIDDIGDSRHLTSFSMLGSWSIDSYFKEKAVELALDFLTNWLKIPKEKLYISVFLGNENLNLPFDEETKKNWMDLGIAESHIVALGVEDNFWGPASKTGPCGPCTEVFFDTGIGECYVPGGKFDTSRYVEIWNAGVFMMFSKNSDGTFGNLAFKSVDTGAGLERLSMVLNDFSSVYEIDLILPIKNFLKNLLPLAEERDLRILTDHLRTSALILSERVVPSNESRGYISRKLIRKCVAILKKIIRYNDEISSTWCLEEAANFIIENFRDINKNFIKNKDFIIENFKNEEKKFDLVLNNGFLRLEEFKKEGIISGEKAFDLFATFGLPFDFIRDYAIQNDLKYEEKESLEFIERHKDISRRMVLESKSDKGKIWNKLGNFAETNFLGYENFFVNAKIIRIFSECGEEFESISDSKKCFFVFDKTCVYAKSGGQESDSGKIISDRGEAEIEFADKKNGVYLHFCAVKKGKFKVGDLVRIEINPERRTKISRAHSATHLLHKALKIFFGNQICQQGSKISENKLHFDFNFENQVTLENLFSIEEIVNGMIFRNIPCKVCNSSLESAVKSGAVALFGEKYGEVVRIVEFSDLSKELCGGTHINYTGEIGLFTIVSCAGISKGLKRITALLAADALSFIQNKVRILEQGFKVIGANLENFVPRIEKMENMLKLKKENFSNNFNVSVLKPVKNSPIPMVYSVCKEEFSNKEVLKAANKISGAAIFISEGEKRRVVLAFCKKINLKASEVFSLVLSKFNGKGGGNESIASGVIPDANIEDIIEEILRICYNRLQNTIS